MSGLIVDNFAGGGGASLGIEWALGRPVDIAINHDPEAVAMHRANHPDTLHHCQSVWRANPYDVAKGRPVDLAWFSPDCKHHSKAKGGKPVEKRIRDLAWVVVMWARTVRPAVIMLENVEEFRDWGPLLESGRPCPDRKGSEFDLWVREIRRCGYQVEWRELRACDFGAPTIRKRLFLVARCDGKPIRWPEPTHGPGLIPYRTAAECIDWSIPVQSIFGRKRPLVENTMRRIARGIQRYVIDTADPFIVPVTHHGDARVHGLDEPLRTITTAKRGELALAVPFVSRQFGKSVGSSIEAPIGTVTAGGSGKSALVAAFLAQHNTGMVGHPATKPVSTITQRGTQQALVTSHLLKLRGTCRDGQDARQPMPTLTAGGWHVGEVRAFLLKYYETAVGQSLKEPMHTATAKARFGLVTVAGEEYQIVDIGMRMLAARELFRAQGVPDSYKIDPVVNGKPLSKTAQIRMCGNMVSPYPARELVHANMVADSAELAA
ncbi:MAG: DNA cytosine methyltransferase [Minwuiales bacterium]|nr:DNA cytosine methyltransferase [Minwuiales bacterium]